MLNVQAYLRDGNPASGLSSDLGIGVFAHPSLPLVGLKYESNAPKDHPIVKECRGLVLEAGSWDVVAKPFDRFYNAGELPSEFARFRWDRSTCQSKEDGSLLIVYAYRGAWHVNTSRSFGLDKVAMARMTWAELFWNASGLDALKLDTAYTHVFELCSAYNQVVRPYPRPMVYLLSMFDPSTCRELSGETVDSEAERLIARRPDSFALRSPDEVARFLREKEQLDPTFEGVVLRDDTDLRFKIKTRTYLEAHHAEGGNILHPRRLIPLILLGEKDEAVAYFPALKDVADRIEAELEQEWTQLRDLWRSTWRVENQGDFARSIVGKTRFSSLLFALRRTHGSNQAEEHLRRLWLDSGELIVKMLPHLGP
jgi:RNA ligase